jgi:hypothetical protein
MNFRQQRERTRHPSREVGYVRKPHGGRLRVALAFPNTYFVGMSNLGFQTVYRLFNATDDIVCERCSCRRSRSWRRCSPRARAGDARVADAGREFDVLAFSVSFEWDYTNVLTLLRLAGLPLRAEDRDTGSDPLIVIGGAVTFVNPEPLALFADVIAAGEGEVAGARRCRAGRAATRRRDELLRRLAASAGSTSRRSTTSSTGPTARSRATCRAEGTGAPPVVKKAALKTTEACDPPATRSSRPTPSSARASWSRWCAAAPTCAASAGPATTTCRSARSRPSASSSWPGAARAHASRAGLVSIALCDHPDIEHILRSLKAMGYSISPASLRLDDLTPTIVSLLRRAASARSPSPRRPAPTGCGASSTRP